MKYSFVLALLVTVGCGTESSKSSPQAERIDAWAKETGASPSRKLLVSELLATSARGRTMLKDIKDPEKRRKAEATWAAQTKYSLNILTEKEKQLFVEDGLVGESLKGSEK